MSLNSALSSFVRAYVAWQPHLVNPQYVRKDSTITWDNYQFHRLSRTMDSEDVTVIADSNQYSFQNAIDGGLFQLLYDFADNGEDLERARLAYITTLPLRTLEDVEDLVDSESAVWIRLDFEPHLQMGLAHPSCHLHFSSFPNRRLAVRHVPTPEQFIEFIYAYLYPLAMKHNRLDDDGRYRGNGRPPRLSTPLLAFDNDYASENISGLAILSNPE